MTTKITTLQLDPVCGVEVPATSDYRVMRNGETYCFCGNGCRQLFLRHPSEYLVSQPRPRPVQAAAPGTAARRTIARTPERREREWSDYVPLIALIDVALLVACAKQLAYGGDLNGQTWMQDFMGLSFVLLAMLKFFDLHAFAEGFRSYDLLARFFSPYAFLYPFLELALGLAYLAHWRPVTTYLVTIGLMVFSVLGVARAIWRGFDAKPTCPGNVLKVPLSTVATAEYVAMAALATAMLVGFGT